MSDMGIKNIWDIQAGGGSNVDTTNLAKKNEENTFTSKNKFKNTGDILTIQTSDMNSGGIDFKQSNDNRIGYIGGSQNTPNKMTLWGKDGLILQANGQNVEVNSGAGLLKYTTSNTTKDRQEVMVRNDMWYTTQWVNHTSFNVPASGQQSSLHTITGLTTGLNELYVVITTSTVDVGFDMKIYVNNTNYPNQSEVKVINMDNWTNTQINTNKLLYFGVILFGNNQLRWRLTNTHNQQITINALKIWKRKPAGIERSN